MQHVREKKTIDSTRETCAFSSVQQAKQMRRVRVMKRVHSIHAPPLPPLHPIQPLIAPPVPLLFCAWVQLTWTTVTNDVHGAATREMRGQGARIAAEEQKEDSKGSVGRWGMCGRGETCEDGVSQCLV